MLTLPTSDGLLYCSAETLEPGMFVAALDRPWQETPFARRGFHLRRDADVALVRRYCSYVYVDPAKDRRPGADRTSEAGTDELDFQAAKSELATADAAVRKVFDELKRRQRVDLTALHAAVDPVIEGVLRDGEAMTAMLRVRQRGEYLYSHSLSNVVWAAIMGRHLGMQPRHVNTLALSASVLDVGMTRVTADVVAQDRALSADEMAEVRRHVELGLELLSASGADPEVLAIVQDHHERFDGSGYPRGLKGHEIPMLARVAGLVDTYDAMITARPYAPVRTSFEVLQSLWHEHANLFQPELIEQLIQAIGLFPTGCIVELSSGEVAIVVKQNRSRRLSPRVLVVLDENKQALGRFNEIDLDRQTDRSRGPVRILNELPKGAYGISPDEFFL